MFGVHVYFKENMLSFEQGLKAHFTIRENN